MLLQNLVSILEVLKGKVIRFLVINMRFSNQHVHKAEAEGRLVDVLPVLGLDGVVRHPEPIVRYPRRKMVGDVDVYVET